MPIWHLKARQLFKCLPCAFTEQGVVVLSSALWTFGRNLLEGEAMEEGTHPRFTDLSSGRSCGQPCDVG